MNIQKNKRFIDYIQKGILFLLVSVFMYMITSERFTDYIVLTGLPIQNIKRLFMFHMIANGLLFSSLMFLGILFIRLYYKLKEKTVPFVGFLWVFGGLKIFASLIFLMNIINVWRAYYWIDGTLRLFAGIFALGSAISFYNSFNQMASMKSPEEYQQLKNEIKRVLDIQEKIVETKIEKNA